MIGYVYDDGGRSEAGYKGAAGDCVARAMAIMLEEPDGSRPYRYCYRTLAQGNADAGGTRSARNGVMTKIYSKIFEAHGLTKVKLPKGPRPTYTEAYERYGNCLVKTTKHVCAIINGQLHDTFDGRTYEWDDGYTVETKERKAQSIWILA